MTSSTLQAIFKMALLFQVAASCPAFALGYDACPKEYEKVQRVNSPTANTDSFKKYLNHLLYRVISTSNEENLLMLKAGEKNAEWFRSIAKTKGVDLENPGNPDDPFKDLPHQVAGAELHTCLIRAWLAERKVSLD